MKSCCRNADLRECSCCGKTFRAGAPEDQAPRCCPECGDSHTRSLEAKRKPRAKPAVATIPAR